MHDSSNEKKRNKKRNHVENNTWASGDMEFLIEFSTWYHEWDWYWVENEKKNSISPSNHVLFCFMITLNTLIARRSQIYLWFKKRKHCHSLMTLNRVSDVSSQTHIKLSIFYVWRYGLVRNPYEALQLIIIIIINNYFI